MKVIIADGTPAEIRELFGDQLDDAARPVRQRRPAPEVATDEESTANGRSTTRLVRELDHITERALLAIEHIAQHAPRVSYDTIAEAGGFESTLSLAGSMSSLGHSAPAIQRMIRRDPPRREYVIDTEDARVLLEAIGEHRSKQ